MNTKEKMALQPTNEKIAQLLKERNKGTADCMMVSEIARQIGMTGVELNRFLIDKEILKRNRREKKLELSLKYQNRGLTKSRSRFGYDSQGQLFEEVYQVWTEKGVEFLRREFGLKIEYNI